MDRHYQQAITEKAVGGVLISGAILNSSSSLTKMRQGPGLYPLPTWG
jgi:hypothetical protein